MEQKLSKGEFQKLESVLTNSEFISSEESEDNEEDEKRLMKTTLP
jgi:hypothetical protein